MTYIPPIGDATASKKGLIRISGDITGTADSPRIADNTIGSAQIIDGSIAENNFTQAVQDKLNATSAMIDDAAVKATSVWSSAKTNSEITNRLVTGSGFNNWAAAPSGSDDTTTIDDAIKTGKRLRPGTYNYNGTGVTGTHQPILLGAGRAQTIITIQTAFTL